METHPRCCRALPPKQHFPKIGVKTNRTIPIIFGLKPFVGPIDHTDRTITKIDVTPFKIQDLCFSEARKESEPDNRRDSCVSHSLKKFTGILVAQKSRLLLGRFEPLHA